MSWKKSTLWFTIQCLKYGGLGGFANRWRYKNRWEASLQPGKNSISDEQAWLNFPALDFLDQHLSREHRVFEYGGGGSTLFFLKRVASVATVENDADWFEILSQKVQQKGWTDRWRGFFQKGEPTSNVSGMRSPARPEDFMSNAPGEGHLNYEKYAKSIENFPFSYFDVVLVDGRARPSCIVASLHHLKKHGILVVDNMEREYYHTMFVEYFPDNFEILLQGRYPVPYHPDFTDTTIFRKK